MGNRFKRLAAAFIDFYIGCLISSVLVAIVTLGKLDTTPFSLTVYFVSFFIVFFLRDLAFKNASFGKRILRLKVIKVDGTKLRVIDVVKRTFLGLLLSNAEAIMVLANGRRLGDFWAKTEVVSRGNRETGNGSVS